MKIPLAKPYFTDEEVNAVKKTILSGWVTQGPMVAEFERKFAAYVGAKYAVAVSSCTTALHLAMIVSNIQKNDQVICPSFSFIATANAIRYVGAKPVFSDIDEKTSNLDPLGAENKITKQTKAILLVHQMGLPADIDSFKKICQKNNLKLIEDAACAIGSRYKNKKIGSHSDLVCFSLHPRKIITTGDGGMITTSSKKIYERLKRLRQHGMSVDDRTRHKSNKIIFEEYLELGYNYRMTDIQASIGIKQLKKIDWIISERRIIAKKYNQAFGKINCLEIPKEPKDCFTNYQSYSLYLNKDCPIFRNMLMQKLLNRGIATKPGIMTIHRQKAYADSEYQQLKLPISEKISDRSLILPLWVGMNKREINCVIKNIIDLTKTKSD